MLSKVEAERIAALKFFELKGQDCLEKYKDTLYVSSGEDKDIVFVNFCIGKADAKEPEKIRVDETVEWDEVVIIQVNKMTGLCNVIYD